jgi:hypothetical protein
MMRERRCGKSDNGIANSSIIPGVVQSLTQISYNKLLGNYLRDMINMKTDRLKVVYSTADK